MISISEWKQWKEWFDQSDLKLIPVKTNLIDLVWKDERPPLPSNPLWIYPIEFAGLESKEKIELIRKKLREHQLNHLIIHRTDDIACSSSLHSSFSLFILNLLLGLFNLRGNDIPFNPVFLSFSILSFDQIQFVHSLHLSIGLILSFRLFVDLNKVSSLIVEELRKSDVDLLPYESFYTQLEQFVHNKPSTDKFAVR